MKKFLLMISLAMLIAFSANHAARAMTAYQKDVCDTWIHGSAAAAAGSGAAMAQIPGTDFPVILGILGTLTVRLAAVFDLDIDIESAKKIAYAIWKSKKSTSYALTARGISQFLFGWIPGIGNGINAISAAGVVEYIGWEIADHFDKGATITEIVRGEITSNITSGIKDTVGAVLENKSE